MQCKEQEILLLWSGLVWCCVVSENDGEVRIRVTDFRAEQSRRKESTVVHYITPTAMQLAVVVYDASQMSIVSPVRDFRSCTGVRYNVK